MRAHVKTHRALTECMLALTRIKNKIAYDTDLVLEMKAWENVCSQLWAPELVFFFFFLLSVSIFSKYKGCREFVLLGSLKLPAP